MRGLSTAAGPGPGVRQASKAVITAVTVFAALGLFVSACGTGGTGARDEGPADNDSLAAGAASPSLSASVDGDSDSDGDHPSVDEVVRMVRADPEVSRTVKSDLKPCVADEYPVDVSYGNLTGGSGDDLVVNVMTCADAVGVASYVYRSEKGTYRSVFLSEQPPVYAEIDRGDLMVTRQLYENGDPSSYPSSEEVTTYRWIKDGFVQRSSTRTEYSSAVGGAETATPETG
ncbi:MULTISPECIES: hypothetical protein [Streptomyces]|uniref:Putative membrane protein n=1 Tax=Streptomyces scabiei (strain 87.22) TaxID=680198 RepID=C9Z0Q9_STRSW|nr:MULTISPECIES: hypothetical protein [Streptomyces]MBP5862016.1 hypothetical protein [Streptomyces sp. LBUM 1484]MBP5907528.1 hypothetical protein [Streptomyces sp. LBUM 1478]MBP5929571.1 hypothetical protein [Streptomyces sp. LBUM 1479]KFG07028.1 hypothetical protein IQ61_21745 [Streptomyces scabiei]MBP5877527.1 hypothetical protein [Streptomyces sp. LBUM 1477]